MLFMCTVQYYSRRMALKMREPLDSCEGNKNYILRRIYYYQSIYTTPYYCYDRLFTVYCSD